MKPWARYGIIALIAVGVVLAVVLVVRGVTGGGAQPSAVPATPTAPPSPTAPPTPAPVIWAGEVCVARDNLGTAVSGLGRNLSYDVTSDKSALEQIDRQLRLQALAVGDALSKLGTALQGVPVDLQQANDFVVTTTKAKDDTSEALEATRQHLDAMVNADSIVTGVAEAGQALVAGKAAYEAGKVLVSTLSTGVSQAGTEVQAAFDAAPQCAG